MLGSADHEFPLESRASRELPRDRANGHADPWVCRGDYYLVQIITQGGYSAMTHVFISPPE